MARAAVEEHEDARVGGRRRAVAGRPLVGGEDSRLLASGLTNALVIGLPWQRLGESATITVL